MNTILLDIKPVEGKLIDQVAGLESTAVVEGATYVPDDIFGTVLNFDGVDDYLKIPKTDGVKAISMWVNLPNYYQPYTTRFLLDVRRSGARSGPYASMQMHMKGNGLSRINVDGLDSSSAYSAILPRNIWTHVYLELETGFKHPFFLMRNNLGGKQGGIYQKGKIAQLRLHSEALTSWEIQSQRKKDLEKTQIQDPLAFDIYLDQNSKTISLEAVIHNDSENVIVLPNSQNTISENNYHFSLVFQPGLLDFGIDGIQNYGDWVIKRKTLESGRIKIWMLYNNRFNSILEIPPKEKIHFKVGGIKVLGDIAQLKKSERLVELKDSQLNFKEAMFIPYKSRKAKLIRMRKHDALIFEASLHELVHGKLHFSSWEQPPTSKNTSIVKGASLYTDDRFGRVLSFDGVEDCIKLPKIEGLRSISMWVNLNAPAYDKISYPNKHRLIYAENAAGVLFQLNNNSKAKNLSMQVNGQPAQSWKEFPQNEWFHLYLELEAVQDQGTSISLMATKKNQQATDGKLSRIQIYNKPLSAEEIKATYEAIIVKKLSPHPLAFSLVNLDKEKSFYLTEDGIGTEMELKILNTSKTAIILTNNQTTPGPDNFHFGLKFQAGALDFQTNGIQLKGDWTIKSELLANGIVKAWILYNKNGEALTIPAGKEISMTINGLLPSNQPFLLPVAFSPEEQQFSLVNSDDQPTNLWKSKGLELKNFPHAARRKTAFAFSPDGNYILTGADREVILWDLEGREIKKFSIDYGNRKAIQSAAFSPDGKQVILGGNAGLRLYDLEGREIQSFSNTGTQNSVAFSPDGKFILFGGQRNPSILNLKNGKTQGFPVQLPTGLDPFPNFTTESVAFSPDSQYTLIGYNFYRGGGRAVLGGLKGKTLKILEHNTVVNAVAFSPNWTNEQLVLTGSSDRTAKLWDDQGNERMSFSHDGAVTAVAFSPDGQFIVTGCQDKTARVWNLLGKEVKRFIHHNAVTQVAFSPDAQKLLTSQSEQGVTLWDLEVRDLMPFKVGGSKIGIKLLYDHLQYKGSAFVLRQNHFTNLKLVPLKSKQENLAFEFKLDKLVEGRLLDSSKEKAITSMAQVHGASIVEDEVFGKVMNFDGEDDYIQFRASGNIKAVSMWLNVPESSATIPTTLLSFSNSQTYGLYITRNELRVASSSKSLPNLHLHGHGIASKRSFIPRNKWVHLYFEFDIRKNKSTLLRFMGEQNGSLFSVGKLSHIRIYNKGLKTSEIQAQRKADIAVLFPDLPLNPLYFGLLNNKKEKLLTVTENNSVNSMDLVISNYATEDVVLVGNKDRAYNFNYHFELEFQAGLLDFTEGGISVDGNWTTFSKELPGNRIKVWITYNLEGKKWKILANKEKTLKINGLKVLATAGQNGNLSASVILDYNQIAFKKKNFALFGSRTSYLQIVNHQKLHPELSLDLKLDNLVNGKLIDSSRMQPMPLDTAKINGAEIVMDEYFGSVLRFDGVEDYVKLPGTKGIKAISMWVYLTDDSTADSENLIFSGDNFSLSNVENNNISKIWVGNPDVGIETIKEAKPKINFPKNKWIYIYAELVNAVDGDLFLMRGSSTPTDTCAGRLSRLRIFNSPLTETVRENGVIKTAGKIDMEYQAGISIMNTYRSLHPIDFNFLNGEKNNGENTLFITASSTGETMTAEIRNTSARDIILTGKKGKASESNYHFMLEFRPGVLDFEKCAITTSEDWNSSITQKDAGDTVKIWCLYNNESASLEISAANTPVNGITKNVSGPIYNLNINGLVADGKYGSRGTQIQLQYNQLSYKGEETALAKGAQIAYLNIVSHVGKEYIPLHVGFVGSNRVLNGRDGSDTGSDELYLRITNIHTEHTIRWQENKSGNNASQFTFTFVGRTDTPESILTSKAGINMHVDQKNLGPEGGQSDTGTWVYMLEKDLGPGEFIDVAITGIKCDKPTGIANLYVYYEDIPGFWDGQFVVPIEKAPLVFSDEQSGNDWVGIGTDDPLAKLHLKGDLFVDNGKVGIGADVPESLLHLKGKSSVQLIIEADTDNSGESDHPTIQFRQDGRNVTGELGYFNDNDLHLKNNYGGAELVLNHDGNVGIGVTIPVHKLEVDGSLKAGSVKTGSLEVDASVEAGSLKITGQIEAGSLEVSGQVKTGSLWIDESLDAKKATFRGTHRWSHFNYSTDEDTYIRGGKTNSNVIINDDGGNVGIGTNDPDSILHLSGTSSVQLIIEADTNNYGESDHPSILFKQDGGLVTGELGYFDGTNHLHLKNNYGGAELMLKDNGSVKASAFSIGQLGSIMKKIVVGRIKKDGTISQGTGFTSTRDSKGIYTITFTADASITSIPIMIATGSDKEQDNVINCVATSKSIVEVTSMDPTNNKKEDSSCSFIAIWL